MKIPSKSTSNRGLRVISASVAVACAAWEAEAAGSLWLNRTGVERSMFADRTANRIGQQLEVLITEKGKFSYDLSTDISDTVGIDDKVTQWLFPTSASSFGTHNGALPATSMSGNDTVKGSWKIENKQVFEDYRFSVEITDDLGDGMLIISGKRKVSAGNETYFLRLVGKIRIDDIKPDNTIESTKVSEAVFEIISEGQLSNSQQGGWLEQAYMRGIHPF